MEGSNTEADLRKFGQVTGIGKLWTRPLLWNSAVYVDVVNQQNLSISNIECKGVFLKHQSGLDMAEK